eukprot:GSChrysophyteH1.ASY1.ANO1.2142.1 assembled CDS
MRIRTITYFMLLEAKDFTCETEVPLSLKIDAATRALSNVEAALAAAGYEVQTKRITFNSWTEWMPDAPAPGSNGDNTEWTAALSRLDSQLRRASIDFCSLGECHELPHIAAVPSILAFSKRFNCHVRLASDALPSGPWNGQAVGAPVEVCVAAAAACLDVYRLCGEDGNFRFAVGFDTRNDCPFFPASSWDGRKSPDEAPHTSPTGLAVGLENGDLLFLAAAGTGNVEEASRNLADVMRQAILPVQSIVQRACAQLDSESGSRTAFLGIDASINPGLALADSVGAGHSAKNTLTGIDTRFGQFGTLAAVSAVTAAIKSLGQGDDPVRLCGYSGLMLPVMEDAVLAARASAPAGTAFSLRDLLTFSAVCGVGLDTVPIPGDSQAAQIASVYIEVSALALRLRKPLSVRLLPMTGKQAGQRTQIGHSNPYLTDTTVFSLGG